MCNITLGQLADTRNWSLMAWRLEAKTQSRVLGLQEAIWQTQPIVLAAQPRLYKALSIGTWVLSCPPGCAFAILFLLTLDELSAMLS